MHDELFGLHVHELHWEFKRSRFDIPRELLSARKGKDQMVVNGWTLLKLDIA